MPLLTKKDIKQKNDLVVEEVEVEEWGGSVRVRSMTAKERDEFESEMFHQAKGEKPINVRAHLVMTCCVDEKGNRLFTEADLSWLEKKNFAPMETIAEKARVLAKLTKKDVEKLEKNLEADQAESSNSDSASN